DRMDPRTEGRLTGSRIHPTPVARGALRRVEPMQLGVSMSLWRYSVARALRIMLAAQKTVSGKQTPRVRARERIRLTLWAPRRPPGKAREARIPGARKR